VSPWIQEGVAGVHTVVRVLKESRTKSLVPLPPLKDPTVRVPVATPLRSEGGAADTEHFEIHSGTDSEMQLEVEGTDSESSEEQQEELARGAAVDAEFVLDANDVEAFVVQPIGGRAVAVRVALVDGLADGGRVVVPFGAVVHSDHGNFDALVGDGLGDVSGEGGETTKARGVVADESDFTNGP
jgi:hypothetical protein